jgi:hypothetical protein
MIPFTVIIIITEDLDGASTRWVEKYISACSNSVQLVPLHPIIISILFHHYKELTACISEVEIIENRVNSKKKAWLTIKKEEKVRKFVISCILNSSFPTVIANWLTAAFRYRATHETHI